MLYQAGTSARGKAFAARHAEGVFLLPRDDAQARAEIADLRRLTVQAGRAADHVKAFLGVEIVTAPTREEVAAKIAVLQQNRDVEGHLVLFSGWSGIDLSGADGIIVIQHLSPGTFEDFADYIVPELQRRGRYRMAYTPGETLRERFFGAGNSRPLPDHPAARLVGSPAVKAVV